MYTQPGSRPARAGLRPAPPPPRLYFSLDFEAVGFRFSSKTNSCSILFDTVGFPRLSSKFRCFLDLHALASDTFQHVGSKSSANNETIY